MIVSLLVAKDAKDEEMHALMKKNWHLVLKAKVVKPVTCKWAYKIKCKADGSVDIFKLKLVARGFSEKIRRGL